MCKYNWSYHWETKCMSQINEKVENVLPVSQGLAVTASYPLAMKTNQTLEAMLSDQG